MAARRAPRLGARGVHAIEEPALLLPDPIAIDTSFMVEALIESQPLHGACKAFADRIADVGVRVVVSELLGIELAEAAFAIALKDDGDASGEDIALTVARVDGLAAC